MAVLLVSIFLGVSHSSFTRLQSGNQGPERNTIQWSPDGINFEIMSHIKWGPPAAGLDQSLDFDRNPLEALSWGLTHQYVSYDWQYIKRFEGSRPFNP